MISRNLLTILLTAVGLFLAGCGSDSGGGGNADPLVGSYYFAGKSGNDFVYLSVQVGEGNNIAVLEMLFPNSNPSLIYVRKQIGTYTKNGSELDITYSYETCDPIGSHKVNISTTDPSDRIFATIDATTIQLLNVKKWAPEQDYTNTALTIIEDVDCNKFPF